MDKLKIRGGARLSGKVRISGAKNSALPAMAASLLTADELVLENVPMVNDILTTFRAQLTNRSAGSTNPAQIM